MTWTVDPPSTFSMISRWATPGSVVDCRPLRNLGTVRYTIDSPVLLDIIQTQLTPCMSNSSSGDVYSCCSVSRLCLSIMMQPYDRGPPRPSGKFLFFHSTNRPFIRSAKSVHSIKQASYCLMNFGPTSSQAGFSCTAQSMRGNRSDAPCRSSEFLA